VPKIDVTFDIDASGILNVNAKDSATGREQSIRITGSTRLPAADKEKMIKDAERFAEEDKRRREEAEKLNNADAIAYQGERFLADFGEKVSADHRSRIETHIRDIKTAISAKNAEGATIQAEMLKKVLQEAGATLYAQATSPGTSGGGPAGGGAEPRESEKTPHGRVMDAEYRESKP
jgi:molecular chaperone DnaK